MGDPNLLPARERWEEMLLREAGLFVVDAFAERPFSGNPAGVLVLEEPRDERWMQAVASELNLAETSFLYRLPDGTWSLRWFTPVVEVALCGHATLAAAHVLWEGGRLRADEAAQFETKSGRLKASRGREGIWLDFPAVPAEASEEPRGLTRVLDDASYRFVGQTRHEVERETDYLVEFRSERDVRALRPNLEALASLPAGGLIVTARSDDPNYDFVSRYFAPVLGIPEDPVTGSAHCTLGPFWRDLLGKDELRALQASQRMGVLDVRVDGRRIFLGGRAVTVIRGEFIGREADA